MGADRRHPLLNGLVEPSRGGVGAVLGEQELGVAHRAPQLLLDPLILGDGRRQPGTGEGGQGALVRSLEGARRRRGPVERGRDLRAVRSREQVGKVPGGKRAGCVLPGPAWASWPSGRRGEAWGIWRWSYGADRRCLLRLGRNVAGASVGELPGLAERRRHGAGASAGVGRAADAAALDRRHLGPHELGGVRAAGRPSRARAARRRHPTRRSRRAVQREQAGGRHRRGGAHGRRRRPRPGLHDAPANGPCPPAQGLRTPCRRGLDAGARGAGEGRGAARRNPGPAVRDGGRGGRSARGAGSRACRPGGIARPGRTHPARAARLRDLHERDGRAAEGRDAAPPGDARQLPGRVRASAAARLPGRGAPLVAALEPRVRAHDRRLLPAEHRHGDRVRPRRRAPGRRHAGGPANHHDRGAAHPGGGQGPHPGGSGASTGVAAPGVHAGPRGRAAPPRRPGDARRPPARSAARAGGATRRARALRRSAARRDERRRPARPGCGTILPSPGPARDAGLRPDRGWPRDLREHARRPKDRHRGQAARRRRAAHRGGRGGPGPGR